MSRAALVAFGASSLAIAACSDSGKAAPLYGAPPIPLDGGSPDASHADAGTDASPAPLYGGPPISDAGHDAEPTKQDASAGPVYGGPPIVDAGADAEGHDGGHD